MATCDNNRTAVKGRQTLEFDLLDDELKKQVIKCIQERGRISVVLEGKSIASVGSFAGFEQLID